MTAKQLHEEGVKLREQDQFEAAAAKLAEAIFQGVQAGDDETVAGAHGDRALVWKHLFLEAPKPMYLRLMEHDVELMFTLASTNDLKELITKALFLEGEVSILSEDYEAAAEWFKQAVEALADGAAKGDYLYHWGEARYRLGEKAKGKAIVEEGLAMLQKYETETDSFLYHVWLSGGYLRLAELLRQDEPEVAREHLEKARVIIEGDDRLIIRKRQWEKLKTVMDQKP